MTVICPDCNGTGTITFDLKEGYPCPRDCDSGILKNCWKNKEGEILYIPDMESDHIMNCINMLERVIGDNRIIYELALVRTWSHGEKYLSDHSRDALMHEIDHMVEMTDHEWLCRYHETYKELTAEAKKRKLLDSEETE